MNSILDPLNFLKDVSVRLSVELGSTQMSLSDLMSLKPESVVSLDRLSNELIDVMVNGKRIARGEVVIEGERFGLRIVEMEGQNAVDAMGMKAASVPGGDGPAEIVTEA